MSDIYSLADRVAMLEARLEDLQATVKPKPRTWTVTLHAMGISQTFEKPYVTPVYEAIGPNGESHLYNINSVCEISRTVYAVYSSTKERS